MGMRRVQFRLRSPDRDAGQRVAPAPFRGASCSSVSGGFCPRLISGVPAGRFLDGCNILVVYGDERFYL
jgi:hypothetical protein